MVSFTKSEDSIENPVGYAITAPYREGYTFEGWSTSEDGEVEYSAADIKNAPDNTYYAIWTPIVM